MLETQSCRGFFIEIKKKLTNLIAFFYKLAKKRAKIKKK